MQDWYSPGCIGTSIVMDQKEHIATLCALGTLGAAAAGLSFGSDVIEIGVASSGKRKRPGPLSIGWSTSSISATTSFLNQRSVSQPVTPTLDSHPSSISSKRLSSAPKLFNVGVEASADRLPSSRESSKSRRSVLRPRTATSRSTTDKRDSGSSSTWIKRLSSFSSYSTSPAVSIQLPSDQDDHASPQALTQRPSTSASSIPNKLVKRSASHRAISHSEARGHILQRPATSHQRSQAFIDILSRPISSQGSPAAPQTSDSITESEPSVQTRHVWRPFFETHIPRKRRRSESATDASQIRVLCTFPATTPVMLLGSELGSTDNATNISIQPYTLSSISEKPNIPIYRSRRSLSSLKRVTSYRRRVTDPSIHLSRTEASGTISPINAKASVMPSRDNPARDDPASLESANIMSSSPPSHPPDGLSYHPRHSLSTSDQPTTSSDVDGHVFSDTESLDIRSDTIYDSVATRATNTSHVSKRDSRLETIFAARTSDEMEMCSTEWGSAGPHSHEDVQQSAPQAFHDVVMADAIGTSAREASTSTSSMKEDDAILATPPRSTSLHADEFDATPIPYNHRNYASGSSPLWLPTTHESREYDRVGDMIDDMTLDDNEDNSWQSKLAWSSGTGKGNGTTGTVSALANEILIARFQETDSPGEDSGFASHKPSIFDWSEQQNVTHASRPKTVHGKKANTDRSRTSGRRGLPQMHFRSQSVPVTRDGNTEELPMTSKYPTWRLGYKGVSEEWGDDFEFDDGEDFQVDSPVVDSVPQHTKDSARSVRIPQAIIDRQRSVHLQFGQVQEFMVQVEELKKLRARGNELCILNGQARHLWEDAESIINLATINDEEDTVLASSPASSDPFTEFGTLHPDGDSHTTTTRPRRTTLGGRRSVSTMTPPPAHGRARGQSLAHARHFLQAMHETRDGVGSSPREIEIHKQKKLPFDTQDLKDLVIRSGAITRALKEELRKAEGVSVSPYKPPSSKKEDDDDNHPLNELFRVPEPREASSPCPPFQKPVLAKSRSAHSYLDSGGRQILSPFSSPVTLAAAM